MVKHDVYLFYSGVYCHNLWDILEFIQKILDLCLKILKPHRRYFHLWRVHDLITTLNHLQKDRGFGNYKIHKCACTCCQGLWGCSTSCYLNNKLTAVINKKKPVTILSSWNLVMGGISLIQSPKSLNLKSPAKEPEYWLLALSIPHRLKQIMQIYFQYCSSSRKLGQGSFFMWKLWWKENQLLPVFCDKEYCLIIYLYTIHIKTSTFLVKRYQGVNFIPW